MDDIDYDDSALDDEVLIERICGNCQIKGPRGQSSFRNHERMTSGDQLASTNCDSTSRVVLAPNEDSVSESLRGEQSSDDMCTDNPSENEQTYVFTIDGDSGLIHATPVKKECKNEESDKGDTSSCGQAWFTSRDGKRKLLNNGYEFKQGMWSKDEIKILDESIKNYCLKHNLTDPAEVIFEMTKDERKDFYRTISKGLNRPLFSVYRRVIRMYDKKNHVGRYTTSERYKLKKLREQHGKDWQAIGSQLGRSASSIKDKCRLMKDHCNTGKWYPEEEKLLTEAVYDLSNVSEGEVVSTGISWTKVAEKVGTRSEKQCRTKWLNYLNWKHTGGSEWTREDDVKLVTKIYNSEAEDETEVDWLTLASGWKSVRSPQWLRGKWWCLKRHVVNVQSLKFRDICNQLYAYHVENSKMINNDKCLNNETALIDTVKIMTPPLPQVRFVSIPNVVHIPQSVNIQDASKVISESTTSVLKSESTSVALQTFEIVSNNLPNNGNSGAFFITSQGTTIHYTSNSSASSIILQTLATDSIQMNVPTQLIITNSTSNLLSSTVTDDGISENRVPSFVPTLLNNVSLTVQEVNSLGFDDNTLDENGESDNVKRADITIQTNFDHNDQPISAEFILSDPILQSSSDSVLNEDEVLAEHIISEENRH